MKQKNGEMPQATIQRLPQYFRCLRAFLLDNEIRVTSEQIALRMGLGVMQVRADLKWFDGAGQRGYGYATKALYTEIAAYLGSGEGYCAVVIDDLSEGKGAEDILLGRCGVRVLAYLDQDQSDDELIASLKEYAPKIGVIGQRCREPMRIARLFELCGIKGILNESDGFIDRAGMAVRSCTPSDEALLLCREIKRREQGDL